MAALTILIVDDDEIDHFYTKRIITKKAPEIKILAAFDGAEALEIMKGCEIDVILLDVNMPGQNGFDFLKALTVQDHQRWPIIFMLSSSTYTKDKEAAEQYSFVKGFLEKPLEPCAVDQITTAVAA